jgi:hypothetical protein
MDEDKDETAKWEREKEKIDRQANEDKKETEKWEEEKRKRDKAC